MGITSPLFPDENTSGGRYVGFGTPFDPVADPEDDGVDVVAFANFMRSTKAPSRGRITRDVQAGEALFNQVGCNACHVVDAAHGAAGHAHQRRRVHASRRRWATRSFIPTAISCCTTSARATAFRCCRDRSTRRPRAQIRTAPLWALRTRNRLMHDGLSFTKQEAIQRHADQAPARAIATTR